MGLTVETISREISKLKRNGLISTNGPHKIVLRRIGGLREIARVGTMDLQPRATAPLRLN